MHPFQFRMLFDRAICVVKGMGESASGLKSREPIQASMLQSPLSLLRISDNEQFTFNSFNNIMWHFKTFLFISSLIFIERFQTVLAAAQEEKKKDDEKSKHEDAEERKVDPK